MYIPKHFNISDNKEVMSFIEANSFGQFISNVKGRIISTHLPFFLSDGGKKINGHFAKQNPQWQYLDQQEILITLQGVHEYISPTWYKSPGVPTWNYQAVHIYGSCTLVNSPEDLQNIVTVLTKKNEMNNMEVSPSYTDNGNYNKSLLNAIVGFEIEITEIQCKYKLSQNRSADDQISTIQNLEKKGALTMAKAMRKVVKRP